MGARLAITVALAAAALLMLLLAADADGGTYEVRQCQHQAPQNHSHEALTSVSPSPGPYSVAAGSAVCSSATRDYAIQTEPTRVALNGQYGVARFVAPDGTKIVGVELNARLRNEAGHRARLALANAAGIEKVRFAAGGSEPTSFRHYSWPAGPLARGAYQQFTAGLFCDNPGSLCPISGSGYRSKADIRDVKLTLRDDVPPVVSLSGALVAGGWVRGTSDLELDAEDKGGGLRAAAVSVNGQIAAGSLALPCALIPGTSLGRTMSPCGGVFEQTAALNSANRPFVEGANEIMACALDYGQGANADCVTRMVHVDNTPPSLAFASEQAHDDPELIRGSAADATSGLRTDSGAIEYRRIGSTTWTAVPPDLTDGVLSARINSGALEPGDYELRASVKDLAGNSTTTTARADGQPMVLRFPLKAPTVLRASLAGGEDRQVVGYRQESEIAGRLLEPSGKPIPAQEITVVETFADGSLIDRRRRTVRTDAEGRYRSTLPGGPSRNVGVVYEGSRRYSGDSEQGLDLDVRGAARLKISRRRVRAGSSVSFRGRVKRYFARIPAGGKLVEVQVKSGTSWTTLQEATGTTRKGRIVLRHRFRGFYTQPVTFTFRLKATRENGWPYHGAAKSPRQRVTVVPKR